jgi:hypothetical protein
MLLKGVRERRPEVWEVITDDGRLVPPPRVPSYREGSHREAEVQRGDQPRPDPFGGIGPADAGLAVA